MVKEKLELEYPLKSASLNVLWNMVGTAYGLEEWFADKVDATGDRYVFAWNGYGETAVLQEEKPLEYMRFQWEYDAGTDYYMEIRIVRHELSNNLTLLVTVFVEPSEREDEVLMWNKHVEDLRRKLGV